MSETGRRVRHRCGAEEQRGRHAAAVAAIARPPAQEGPAAPACGHHAGCRRGSSEQGCLDVVAGVDACLANLHAADVLQRIAAAPDRLRPQRHRRRRCNGPLAVAGIRRSIAIVAASCRLRCGTCAGCSCDQSCGYFWITRKVGRQAERTSADANTAYVRDNDPCVQEQQAADQPQDGGGDADADQREVDRHRALCFQYFRQRRQQRASANHAADARGQPAEEQCFVAWQDRHGN
mmetsp:Transcript_47518/g.133742  ORF Transcript_47518/g.133742 Transcript_47518/m.133742 type:complete len:235 (+) Transcript_47518:208-912(+)